MGLFRSYQNPGPGINPNAPKKKPFFRYWELLWRNLGKLFSLNIIYTLMHAPLLLSMIVYLETDNKLTNWMVLLLLVIQFLLVGPTLAGCTRVLRLIVLDKAFFLGEEFKKGFSRNFGASLLYWLIDALVIASILAGHWVYPAMAQQTGSNAVYIPYGITISVGVILLFMNFYIMPLQVSTKLKKRSVLKNAFMLSALSLKECLLSLFGTLLLLAIIVLLILFNSYLMFLAAFFPAMFIGYLIMFVHYPVIQKYVINPYYEDSGEINPEDEEANDEDEHIFTDRGGTEIPAPKAEKGKGKVIS